MMKKSTEKFFFLIKGHKSIKKNKSIPWYIIIHFSLKNVIYFLRNKISFLSLGSNKRGFKIFSLSTIMI